MSPTRRKASACAKCQAKLSHHLSDKKPVVSFLPEAIPVPSHSPIINTAKRTWMSLELEGNYIPCISMGFFSSGSCITNKLCYVFAKGVLTTSGQVWKQRAMRFAQGQQEVHEPGHYLPAVEVHLYCS